MSDQPIPASGRAREVALRDLRRADRSAEALRANLRRRKDQARARDDDVALPDANPKPMS